ncbi:MAG: WD40 repeat domain-containing protein [Polyangia bacterium]
MTKAWWIAVGSVIVAGCGGGSGHLSGTGGTVTGTGGTVSGTGGFATGGTGTGGFGTGGTGTGGFGTGGTVATGGVGGGSPAPFALISPVQGSSAQSGTPTLSWQPSSGAASYAVEVATSVRFGNDDVFQNILDAPATSVLVPAGTLLPGVVYYWRVSAENGANYTIATGAPQWFSIPYHVAGAHGLAATSDGTELLVASDVNDGAIDVVDLTTHTVGAIPTGVHSHAVGLAISPDGLHALVTLLSNGADGVNGVALVDLLTNTLEGGVEDPCIATTLTDVAYFPNGAAAMPDLGGDCAAMGLTAFTPDLDNPQFTFTNFHDTSDPYGLAISPSGAFALVTMALDSRVYRVQFGVSLTNITLSAPAAGIAITADGTTAVIAENSLDLVDLVTGAVTPLALDQDVPGTDFHNVAVTPDDEVAAVVGTASIQFISLLTGQVLAAYPATDAGNIALSPDGTLAYVSDTAGSRVRVLPVP